MTGTAEAQDNFTLILPRFTVPFIPDSRLFPIKGGHCLPVDQEPLSSLARNRRGIEPPIRGPNGKSDGKARGPFLGREEKISLPRMKHG